MQSTQYNVEHIFTTIRNPGEYEIWVKRPGNVNDNTSYGLAWWAVGAEEELPGGEGSRLEGDWLAQAYDAEDTRA